MKRSSNGNGNLYEYHGSWYLRIRRNGARHKECIGKFGSRAEAERKAREILDGLPAPGVPWDSLALFIEQTYLPEAREAVRASTYAEYRGMFERHIKPLATLPLARYGPAEIHRLLRDVVASRSLSRTTMKHVKAFLSGAFTHACSVGLMTHNPVRDVRLPAGGSPPRETKAYTLEEIRSVLSVTEEAETRAIIAIAAFAGLRRSEIQGLQWSDYDGDRLHVRRSVWNGFEDKPKSRASKSWVPVIEPLRSILDAYRDGVRDQFGVRLAPDARMFLVTLEHIGRKKVGEAFTRAGLSFSGFHGFRRALASNLFELGAPAEVCQRVLRHSSSAVTMEFYVKVRDRNVDAAMGALETAWTEGPPKGLESGLRQRQVVGRKDTEAHAVR